MLSGSGINFKRYFLLTGISTTILIILVARSLPDLAGIISVYIAACINQIMLARFARLFFSPAVATQRSNIDKGEVVSTFIVKGIILAAGITLGVLFMGNRVIFPIINYVFQMFALYYSLVKPLRPL